MDNKNPPIIQPVYQIISKSQEKGPVVGTLTITFLKTSDKGCVFSGGRGYDRLFIILWWIQKVDQLFLSYNAFSFTVRNNSRTDRFFFYNGVSLKVKNENSLK